MEDCKHARVQTGKCTLLDSINYKCLLRCIPRIKLCAPSQKQKHKAPAQPKGFGAILEEAQDVVAGRLSCWSPTPTFLNRLSEIQLQNEAYINQQIGRADEGKHPRMNWSPQQ